MKLKLGDRIKELRIRSNKTQEDLAKALGVSYQAVSRWENNRSYPDIEILPNIANYFHITIDKLFGYDGEYEEKIINIISKADEYINDRSDLNKCIELLRSTFDEFPNEGRIWCRLGLALSLQLSQNNDIRINPMEQGNTVDFNSECNSSNILLSEAIKVYEKTLEMDIPRDYRDAITMSLAFLYSTVGMSDKGYQLASNQQSIYCNREYICAMASTLEDREANNFNLMIAVLRILKTTVLWSIGTNHTMRSTKDGINMLVGMVELYKGLFSEDLGLLHSDIYDIYIGCICISIRMNDYDEIIKFLDLAIFHRKEYDIVRKRDKYKHSSPLFSSIEYNGEQQPEYTLYRLQDIIKLLPEELKQRMLKEEKYIDIMTMLNDQH